MTPAPVAEGTKMERKSLPPDLHSSLFIAALPQYAASGNCAGLARVSG